VTGRGPRRAGASRIRVAPRRAQPGNGRTSGEAGCEPQAASVAASSDTSASDGCPAAGRAPAIQPEVGRALTEADFCRLIEAIRREREHPRSGETCPD
jgi:hypothetical protein